MKQWAPQEVEFYKQRYIAASKGNYDIYVVFVERGLQFLNWKGKLGFILPHKFFNAQYGEPLRGLIAEGQHLSEVVHFGDNQVFDGATTYTCLMFLEKGGSGLLKFSKVDDLQEWEEGCRVDAGEIPAIQVTCKEWNFSIGAQGRLFEKLSRMPVRLGDVADLFVGLQTSADTIFLFKDSHLSPKTTTVSSKELGRKVELENGLLKVVVRSGKIGRFWAEPSALVLFPYVKNSGKFGLIQEGDLRKKYPKTWEYLNASRRLLTEREHGKFASSGWYQLYPKNLDCWEKPKILLPYMVTRLSAYYDEDNLYFVNVTTGGFGLTLRTENFGFQYLVGLLNSRLLDWFLKKVSTTFHGGYFAANKQFLVQLPIRLIDFDDKQDRARHDRMVALVEQMLTLHRDLAAANTAHDKTLAERQIAATDKQIDRLVYELYGLTEAEIAVVEGGGAAA
jgi:hypothetical protein